MIQLIHALGVHERIREMSKKLLPMPHHVADFPLLPVPCMKREGTNFCCVCGVFIHIL